MKQRIAITVLILILFPLWSSAQEALHFAAGISVNNLHGNFFKNSHTKNLTGFSALFGLEHRINTRLAICHDLAFERKGAIYQADITGLYPKATTAMRFSYLTLPIMLRFQGGKTLKYFIGAGAFAGFLLRETETISAAGKADRVFNYTEIFNVFDWGACGSLGVLMPLKERLSISCEARYHYGLNNLNTGAGVNSGTLQTRSLSLLFGLRYQFSNQASTQTN